MQPGASCHKKWTVRLGSYQATCRSLAAGALGLSPFIIIYMRKSSGVGWETLQISHTTGINSSHRGVRRDLATGPGGTRGREATSVQLCTSWTMHGRPCVHLESHGRERVHLDVGNLLNPVIVDSWVPPRSSKKWIEDTRRHGQQFGGNCFQRQMFVHLWAKTEPSRGDCKMDTANALQRGIV